MTTEKQLTLSDLLRLPREVRLRAIYKRAGVVGGTIESKLKRLRDGTSWPGNELDPDQAERLTVALREVWGELGEVIGER